MKIEGKLDNPKYCDGCPMLLEADCACKYYPYTDILPENHKKYGNNIRPEICITENGE